MYSSFLLLLFLTMCERQESSVQNPLHLPAIDVVWLLELFLSSHCVFSLSCSIGVNKPHYNCILFINWTIHAQCKKFSSEHKLMLVAGDGDGATVTASTAFIYFKLLATYMSYIYVHILILKYTFHKRKTYAAHAFEQHTYMYYGHGCH